MSLGKCPNCGEPHYPQDTFCNHCGYTLVEPYDPEKATHSGSKYKSHVMPDTKTRDELRERIVEALEPMIRSIATSAHSSAGYADWEIKEEAADFADAVLALLPPEGWRAERAQLLEIIEAADWAQTRLDHFADLCHAGTAQDGGREWKRRVWGAFSDFNKRRGALPKAPDTGGDDGN